MPGIRGVLGFPLVYRLFSYVVGADGGRRRLVAQYIRPAPGDRVLDIGCGPAEILGYLPQVEYFGFDVSPSYIDDAKQHWNSRGEFTCANVSEQTLTGKQFDIVLAIGVLHHLDDGEARELFRIAFEALTPGGRLVTLDGAYVEGQSPLVRFILSKDRGNYVREVRQYEELARSAFAKVKCDVAFDLIKPMPYTHLVMECTR